MKIISGKKPKPRRTLLYGVHGIGKSTWAAEAPNPFFLDIENGLDDIECERTEVCRTLEDVGMALAWLLSEKHDFQNVVVDSADWLEGLFQDDVAHVAGKPFADIGFGNGPKQCITRWNIVIDALERLRAIRGMGVILLAHCQVKKHTDPEMDSYDRYMPALHESASAVIQEWCDEVLFANYRVFVRKEDVGFNKERGIGVGGKERFIRTQENAGCLAKNRLGKDTPEEIPFSFADYAKYFPKSSEEAVTVKTSTQKAG